MIARLWGVKVAHKYRSRWGTLYTSVAEIKRTHQYQTFGGKTSVPLNGNSVPLDGRPTQSVHGCIHREYGNGVYSSQVSW